MKKNPFYLLNRNNGYSRTCMWSIDLKTEMQTDLPIAKLSTEAERVALW